MSQLLTPPAEVMEAMAKYTAESSDTPPFTAAAPDPTAHAVVQAPHLKVPESLKPPATSLGERFTGLGLLSDGLRIREAPYDYAGSDPAGLAFGFPQTGRLSVGGRVGQVDNATPGDRVRFTGWIGIAVTNESAGSSPGQTVRVSPSISWEAGWTLGGAGADGWGEARGGVALKVFSSTGFVTENQPPIELFQDHFSHFGPAWDTKDGSDSGSSTPSIQAYFPIPAGETRWVNVDAYCELAHGSNLAKVGAALGGLAATITFIVIEP